MVFPEKLENTKRVIREITIPKTIRGQTII
jgi:hypothetical protein